MISFMKRNFPAALLLSMLLPPQAFAATPLEQRISPVANKIFHDSKAPAMLIVVIHGNEQFIKGFGTNADGSKPQADSLLRIDSLSKLFAAELMAMLVSDGQLNLNDPLQLYAPASYKVPQSGDGKNITLLQLATHTSGLPRSLEGKPPAGSAPFTWPEKAERWQWLDHAKMPATHGADASYSNAAYDFLADALESAGGKPYDVQLRERITTPLGMRDTTATPSQDQCARLIGGADARPCTSTLANAGSGGLYSTATDISIWMRHLLEIDGRESKSLQRLEAGYVSRERLDSVTGLDKAGRASAIGLGWIHLAATDGRPEILQKTGGGAGFMSYIAIAPATQNGIFIIFTKVDTVMLQRETKEVNDLLVKLGRP